MTALFIPRFAKVKSVLMILFSLMVWIYPEVSMAASLQNEGQNQLVFEVKNLNSNSNLQSGSVGLRLADVAQNDPLVNNLKLYLAKHSSPLSEYSDQIILQPQWQRALAISYVESHFGRFCHSNNCSGIGGAPGMRTWRKYTDKLQWFKDMAQLMEKPIYKDKYNTFQKMKGVYVQPGTANWVNGATKKYDELMKLTEESETQRIALAQKNTETLALATFPDNSNIE